MINLCSKTLTWGVGSKLLYNSRAQRNYSRVKNASQALFAIVRVTELTLSPRATQALVNHGCVLASRGEEDESRAFFVEAASGSSCPEATYNLGYVLILSLIEVVLRTIYPSLSGNTLIIFRIQPYNVVVWKSV